MTDNEHDYGKDDLLDVSHELDERGEAEFTNPGDPLVDDEESLDEGLLDGEDTAFGVENDIDTLRVEGEAESNDDL